jgi:hypothetical protein
MNVDMLRRSQHSLVRLRPMARPDDDEMSTLPDDDWRIDTVDRTKGLEITKGWFRIRRTTAEASEHRSCSLG